MYLRNSHVTHVAQVQESINSETLENLGMVWNGFLQIKDYLPLKY